MSAPQPICLKHGPKARRASRIGRKGFYCRTCQKENRSHSAPEYLLYWSAQARARKKGLPFTIKMADIHVPDTCPILGIPLQRQRGRGGSTSNSPSLDQIVPGLGYVPENIQVISHRANTIKSNATLAELEALVAFLKQLHHNTP